LGPRDVPHWDRGAQGRGAQDRVPMGVLGGRRKRVGPVQASDWPEVRGVGEGCECCCGAYGRRRGMAARADGWVRATRENHPDCSRCVAVTAENCGAGSSVRKRPCAAVGAFRPNAVQHVVSGS